MISRTSSPETIITAESGGVIIIYMDYNKGGGTVSAPGQSQEGNAPSLPVEIKPPLP